MSSDEFSDEIETVSPKKAIKQSQKNQVKIKTSGEPKKISTKHMIHEALQEIKTRKGVSMHAIKKYLEEKYDVDTKKNNHFIKKQLKSGVEDGTIAQIKGIGATGSFKLILAKEQSKNKKIIATEAETAEEKPAKSTAKIEKDVKPKKMVTEKAVEETSAITKKKAETIKTVKKDKSIEKKKNNKEDKQESKKIVKKKSIKIPKDTQSAVIKKIAIKKRKSIGSIIKPPRMKPKVKE